MKKRGRGFVATEGWLWAIALDRRWLRLRLFRCITVARVALDDIRYVRQRSEGDLSRLFREAVRRPFRCWYWPHGWMARGPNCSAPYLLHTRRGARIYLRLRPGFHYRLRAAIGEVRAAQWIPAEPPMTLPMREEIAP